MTDHTTNTTTGPTGNEFADLMAAPDLPEKVNDMVRDARRALVASLTGVQVVCDPNLRPNQFVMHVGMELYSELLKARAE